MAARLRLNVLVVSNGSRPIRPPDAPNVRMVLVGDSADAADDWIGEYISAADVWVAHNDRVMLRDRKFADSSLERAGFEPSVPNDTAWALSWRLCRFLPTGYPTVQRSGDFGVRTLVKGKLGLAPLSRCRPALSLASSCRSTLFFWVSEPEVRLSARNQELESRTGFSPGRGKIAPAIKTAFASKCR
jgi:hypothetical protein